MAHIVTHPPRRRHRITDVTVTEDRRSIAVVGSGVAGLTAAYTLSRHHRVTLYEADDRLGGHAHTHLVDGGDGEVVAVDSRSWCTTTAPTRRCAGCSTNSAWRPATPTCRCRCARRQRPRVCGRAGHRRAVPHPGATWHVRATCGCSPRSSGSTAPPRGCCGDSRRPTTETARDFLDRHGFSRVLRRALHDPAGRRGVVLPARRRAGLPGALPVRLPRPSRHADGVRLADMAHRRRRFGATMSNAIASRLDEVRAGTR